jgi:signal transduction histidine kinase
LAEIPPGENETYWFPGRDEVLVRTVELQDKLVGFISIRSDRKRLYTRLERYVLIASCVFVLSMLLAWLLSWVFQHSTVVSIQRLVEVSRTVSRDKDYSLRAPPHGSRDEIALLIDSFNEMLNQIESRDRDLQEAHNHLERKVAERTTQLTAANKELESFSYSVSHDLRAPLRSIDGFGQILLDDFAEPLGEEGRSHIQRIRAATQRMAMLIEDLLNLSRVTRGALRKTRVDLSALAHSTAGELMKAHSDREVQIQIEDGLQAEADSGLMRIVFENLFGNAWKFTSKKASASIAFGTIPHNGTPAYFVRDNGVGFDPAYADRLFGAFQRLHSMNDFPGTGVGLATVQRIVHRHGGAIWAESAEGRGATFYFTLSG